MEFSKQEHRSRVPFPSPEYLPDPGSKLCLLHWKVDFFTAQPPEKPSMDITWSPKLRTDGSPGRKVLCADKREVYPGVL